jgi:hypothetical protein
MLNHDDGRFPTSEEPSGITIEVISPEEIRKRARASTTSGLSAGLSRSISLPTGSQTPASGVFGESRQLKHSKSEAPNFSRQSALYELREIVKGGIQEDVAEEDDISPGSRPIVRKPKLKPKADDGPLQSELGRSLADDDKPLTPPHLMSLPAQNFAGHDLCTRPGSLYEGVGRKLRGMDAARFRRSVMRQTGFLEPGTESVVH